MSFRRKVKVGVITMATALLSVAAMWLVAGECWDPLVLLLVSHFGKRVLEVSNFF